MRLSLIFLLCLSWAFSAAHAQSIDPERLNELSEQQEIERAREAELRKNQDSVRKEISSLKADLSRLAAEAKKYERTSRDIERRLADLRQTEARLRTSIYGDRKTLTKLLAALQRIERNPPPPLAVSPSDAAEAARAGKLMASLSRSIKVRTDILQGQLQDLEEINQGIESEKEKLATNEKALEARRASISSVVDQKSKLERSISLDAAETQRKVAALASEANSLRDLIQKFEQATRGVTPRLKPKPGDANKPTPKRGSASTRSTAPLAPLKLPSGSTPFAQAKGKLTAPVSGKISKSYTTARKGITVSVRNKSQVIAPAAGRVEFAGPFKNYDNVIILNVGGGYFMLLTGLGDIYVNAGEILAPGEPLGLMPFNTNSKPELYIEIRKDGSTVNPTPWLGTAFASNG